MNTPLYLAKELLIAILLLGQLTICKSQHREVPLIMFEEGQWQLSQNSKDSLDKIMGWLATDKVNLTDSFRLVVTGYYRLEEHEADKYLGVKRAKEVVDYLRANHLPLTFRSRDQVMISDYPNSPPDNPWPEVRIQLWQVCPPY